MLRAYQLIFQCQTRVYSLSSYLEKWLSNASIDRRSILLSSYLVRARTQEAAALKRLEIIENDAFSEMIRGLFDLQPIKSLGLDANLVFIGLLVWLAEDFL